MFQKGGSPSELLGGERAWKGRWKPKSRVWEEVGISVNRRGEATAGKGYNIKGHVLSQDTKASDHSQVKLCEGMERNIIR